jgi:cobalt-zinc-cadmium efflux system outer membrane protein
MGHGGEMTRTDTVVRALVSALLLGLVVPSLAQPDVVLTLDQALHEALARNPLLAVERTEIAVAAGTLRQARLYAVNPELELEGSAGRARARGGEDERRGIDGKSIGLSQVISLRGQRGLRIQAAEAGVDRATAAVQEAEREVTGELLQTFGDILVAQARVALARDVAALTTTVRDTARKLHETDVVPQLDVFRADVELARVENRLVVAEQTLRTAQRELALLLGRPPTPLVRAEGPLTLPLPAGEITVLQQRALAQRPDLIMARAALRAAEAELALVRREQFFPEVKVGLRYEEAREFDSTNRSGVLALSVPLPLLNRRQGEIDRAMAELHKQEATVQLIQRRIEKEVASASQQVLTSRQITDAYTRRILPEQNRNFGLLREGYNLGQLRLTDVLVGQRELIEAREAYLDAVATLNTAAAALYRAINGRP